MKYMLITHLVRFYSTNLDILSHVMILYGENHMTSAYDGNYYVGISDTSQR